MIMKMKEVGIIIKIIRKINKKINNNANNKNKPPSFKDKIKSFGSNFSFYSSTDRFPSSPKKEQIVDS